MFYFYNFFLPQSTNFVEEELVQGDGARVRIANVGRRLASRQSSGTSSNADREDSPLQSNRSSMCDQTKKNIQKLMRKKK